jgi:ribonuclease E
MTPEPDMLESPTLALDAPQIIAEPTESMESIHHPENESGRIASVQDHGDQEIALPSVGQDGWESVPAGVNVPISAAAAEEEQQIEHTPKPLTSLKAPQAEAPIVAVSRDGITAEGRAINDPRVHAREVGAVEIITSRRAMFSEIVAPPVGHSGRIATRAGNDPRGPRPAVLMAQAAGQS